MTRLAKDWSRRQPRYDVIVIGSGYGGGVSAYHLARLGKSVALLERGREFATGDFPAKFSELKNQLRIVNAGRSHGSETALFDVRIGRDMHVISGCGLGGGSLVNGGVTLRPDKRVFDDPVWPQALRTDPNLETGFERARQWLRPAHYDDAAALAKFRALDRAAKDLGYISSKTPLAVSFQDTTNPAGVAQPACTLCGDCCGGCNVGAKNTVAMTYLPDAANHGAEIFTEIDVRWIEKAEDGSWCVVCRPTEMDREGLEVTRLTSDAVIISAGTLGSTEILLRSRERGLSCSDRLGHGFSANGDIIAFGYGATERINAIGVGHPARVAIDDVGAVVTGHIEIRDQQNLENELYVEEGVLPSALAPMLPVLFLPDGRLLGALKSLINGVYHGPFAHLQTYFAVSHDTAGGTLYLENDAIQLSWPGAKDQPVYQRLDKILLEIVGHAGGHYVKNPLAKTAVGNKPATAHPLGGCIMAETASEGVVNHKCQVFDPSPDKSSDTIHDGLYVIDGSVIPRSLGVNPLFTITALSERALLHFAKDHRLSLNDPLPAGPMTS